MNQSFCIECAWLDIPTATSSVEHNLLASLSMYVQGECATLVENHRQHEFHAAVNVSAFPLVQWVMIHWWRLLWEPQRNTPSWDYSHRVGSAGHGYIWPNLSFSSDWQSVNVSSRPTFPWDAEPVRYVNHFDKAVPLDEFEFGLEHFLRAALKKLKLAGTSHAALLWSEISRERQDEDISRWRSLEACMGFDPDEASPNLVNSLFQQMPENGRHAVQEMAAACQDQAISRMCNLRQHAQKSDIVVHVPECDALRIQISHATREDRNPWVRGEIAASIARETWNLQGPVHTGQLTELYGLGPQWEKQEYASSLRGLNAGFRSAEHSDQFSASLCGRHDTSRRFALARLVADHIDASEEDMLLPGTSALTSRQKFQRAFAQELLCPFQDLKEYIGAESVDQDVMEEAAHHFGVSPMLIEHTLVNKNLLDRDSILPLPLQCDIRL